VLYSFCEQALCADGISPRGGVIRNASGKLYGTTDLAGAHCTLSQECGTVFELQP
jgi:hypothetical protein